MVREQEMLLDELAQFVVMIGQPAAAAVTAAAAAEASGLQGLFQQQQHQCMGQQQQQQLLQQQHGGSSSVTEVAQSLRTCTVACMTDTIFPVSACWGIWSCIKSAGYYQLFKFIQPPMPDSIKVCLAHLGPKPIACCCC